MTRWKKKKTKKKKMMMIKMLELRLMLMSTVIKKQSAGLPLHWVPRHDRTTECLYSACCIVNWLWHFQTAVWKVLALGILPITSFTLIKNKYDIVLKRKCQWPQKSINEIVNKNVRSWKLRTIKSRLTLKNWWNFLQQSGSLCFKHEYSLLVSYSVCFNKN